MSEGEKPRIIIAGKGASIEKIRARAEASRVSPFEPLPQKPIAGPEGEDWAPWIVESRKEVEDIKNEALQVEIRRLARRPEEMVTKSTLEDSYDTIEGLVTREEIQRKEADHWKAKILARYTEILDKEGKASTWDDLMKALPPVMAAAAVHAADELVERNPEVLVSFLRKIVRGRGKERRDAPPGGEGGPPEKPPEEPPKEKGGLPDDFLRLRKLILDDATTEDIRKKAMDKRDRIWHEFLEEDPENRDFIKDTTQTLINTIRDSDWNHVYDDVRNLAVNIENEARNRGILSPGSRYEGMLRAAIAGEALRISKIGFDKRPFIGKPEDARWLIEHGESEESLKLLEKRAERESFFPLGIEPHDFVGTSRAKEFKEPSPEDLLKLLQGEGAIPDGERAAYAGIPPNEVVAVFKQSRLGIFERAWRGKVEFLDVTKKEDLEKWAFLNMEAFNNGIIANPSQRWKGTIDFWLTDLRDAARLLPKEGNYQRLSDDQRREVQRNIADIEKKIKAMMAVSASARAMEVTSGSAAVYAMLITPGTAEGPNLDKSDEWAEFIIHDDNGVKFGRAISDPLVRYFYERILKDAGYGENPLEPLRGFLERAAKGSLADKEYKEIYKQIREKIVLEKEGVDRAKRGNLIKFLAQKWGKNDGQPSIRNEKGEEMKELEKRIIGEKEIEYDQGFNSYIEWLLTAKENEQFRQGIPGLGQISTQAELWAAAKLGCDAFQIDKFTQWEYGVAGTEKAKTWLDTRGKDDPERWESPYKYIMPFPGWGGNPLTVMIMPSFLPRVIKGVYSGEDRAIMDLTDMAFHPPEIQLHNEEMSREIKKLNPEGKEIKELPEETQKKIDELRGKMLDILPASMVSSYKAYIRYNDAHWRYLGGSRGQAIPAWTSRVMEEDIPKMADLLDQAYPGKKRLVGLMMARIIQCKALAAAAESRKPGFKETMRNLFDPEARTRPFLDVLQHLWGPDYDARRGLLAALAGPRVRLVFEGNKNAEAALRDAYDILRSNDQDPKGRGRTKVINTMGFILDAAQAIAKGGSSRR